MSKKKATVAEKEQRVNTVVRLLLDGTIDTRIVPLIAETWGIGERQARNYVSAAWARIKRMADERLGDALSYYLMAYSELRKESKDEAFKREVLRDEVELLGLKKAVRQELDVTSGGKKVKSLVNVYIPDNERE